MKVDLENRLLALELFRMVILRESDVHIKRIAHVVAHNLLFKTRDELAGAQGQLVVVGLAAVKLLAIHIAVKVNGYDVTVLSGTAFHGDDAGVALADTLDLLVDVLFRDFHSRTGHFDALVAFDGSFGLGDHIQLALDAFVLADFVDLKLADADDLQVGFLHRFHHHGAVQMVDGSLIEDFLAIIFLDKSPGGMALAEAGDVDLFAFALKHSVDGIIKLFGADFQLQFIAVGFHFICCFYIHGSDFLSK